MIFAVSMLDPPPTASTKSTSASFANSNPWFTISTVGFGITLSNCTVSISLFFNISFTLWKSLSSGASFGVVTSKHFLPYFEAICPSSSNLPFPKCILDG